MQIGIDFGSTYSAVSKFNPVINNVEAITFSEGEPASIPSVVSISKKGQKTYGAAAKNQAGKKTVRIFEAFKILLTETNEEMLKIRGYDEIYTPRAIARDYLEYLLDSALHTQKETGYEDIVICVPELWRKNVTTLDGSEILRNILQNEIDLPIRSEGVRVVTEPEAASAFYAYHIEQLENKPFNGHLLLIDYGGGTLDLTITKVSSDGNGHMEISYCDGGGAGENHPDEQGRGNIGSAGIAFQQTVVKLAMQEAGFLKEGSDPDYSKPDFIAAERDLESQLKSVEHIRLIEEVFGEYGSFRRMKDILKDKPRHFIDLEYEDEELPVTFQHLYLAYQSCIAGVLNAEIEKIMPTVEECIGKDPRRPESGLNGDFKIALVGGFGSFFLVHEQIADIYHLDPNPDIDPRTKNIATDKSIQAISLGAALIAAGKVILRKISRFSIGLCTKDNQGRVRELFYAIHYLEELETDHPYFTLRHNATEDIPENRIPWGNLAGNIDSFAIEFTDRLDRCIPMGLKPKMLEKLRDLPDIGIWNCGFSVDKNDVFTFHAVPASGFGMEETQKGIKIHLDNYNGMFDLTVAKEVEV